MTSPARNWTTLAEIPRKIYGGALLPLSLLAAPCFFLHRRGRIALRERYGDWELPAGRYTWFHAASLGEMIGMAPVIERYRELYPASTLLLTSTSDSGLARAREIGSAGSIAAQCRMLPFDSVTWIAAALRSVQIERFFFGETEIWPNLLFYLEQRGVPRVLVNGRLSDGSVSRYRALRPLFAPRLAALTLALMSDELSADRVQQLGVPTERICTTGNTKFDRPPIVRAADEALALRSEILGAHGGPVVTLGSIHPGEEEIWLPELKRSLEGDTSLSLIVAPRHPERVSYFCERLQRLGIDYRLRTDPTPSSAARVVVLNTLGELEKIYSFSTLAFIGGTLNTLGGHNPLEAAMYGAALALGPSRHKIRDLAHDLDAVDAILTVRSGADVAELLATLRRDPGALRARGERALQVYERYRGARARVFDLLATHHLLPQLGGA